jgi:poly-gamma-glutamate synthesis protein (capsule biosynthesis protein)
MIGELRSEGYLPIFTFQWNEYYQPKPSTKQKEDFRAVAEAGAVIVSGSQAHQPQAFEFVGDGLIHYGLGNLFFDQMWSIAVRQEFIDRHVFYDGVYISTEVLTAFLEDFAQPRPMTIEEREYFLGNIFSASEW